ncbi:MAG: acyl-CoA dehydrogenase family protein, partial [Marinomonas sp.]
GLLLFPEDAGGFGGDWGDLAAIMRLAGLHALAAPLGEHIIATHIVQACGREALGLLTIAQSDTAPVPWGRHADQIICVRNGGLHLVSGASVQGASPVGEPRDAISYDWKLAQELNYSADPIALIAFLRVCQTAGALDGALQLAIDYCSQRVQFGRPLSKFQAVQQSIALLAVDAAAVNCAAQGAADALDRGGTDYAAELEIASAKLRANIAIKTGSALAHQVHGAIGFTRDYPLHELTRRMMGWRSEGGNDTYWSGVIGEKVLGWGGAGLWHNLTQRTDD